MQGLGYTLAVGLKGLAWVLDVDVGGKNKVNYDLSLKLVNSYLKQEEEELGV